MTRDISARRMGGILAAVLAAGVIQLTAVAAPASAAYPSNDCLGLPVNTWFGGWVGDSFVQLTSYHPDLNTTWVCVAADAGGTHVGGKVVVTTAAASAVTVDDAAGQC